MTEVTPAGLLDLEARLMSERQLQVEIERLLKAHGWRFYHTHRSDRSQPGFPDLCAVRPPRLLFAELKRQKTKLSVDQQGWYADLTTVFERSKPGEVYLWRPMHLLDGTVARLLS